MTRDPGVARSSLEKALELCEILATADHGFSIKDLARTTDQPPSSVHRQLATLKRRGYVRQDDDTARYSLTLKMLDLSFRLLGRSELRLHAYPVLREFVLRHGVRTFLAVPAKGEVTYVWKAGPDEVNVHTAYGRTMPSHCVIFFDGAGGRRLSCIRLGQPRDATHPDQVLVRLGPPQQTYGSQRLLCTCAPVFDYTGREVARVGAFEHGAHEREFSGEHPSTAIELARLISLRLGHLPAVSVAVGA